MDPFFAWIEATALSTWLRDSLWAFPIVLIAHTIGLAFLVGVNVAVDLRLLGVARRVPLAAFDPFFPVMWAGFWLNAVSGVALLIAYPTKALTNPVFYVKLAMIAAGLAIAVRLRADLKVGPYSRDVDTARPRADLKVGPYSRDVDTARARADLKTGPYSRDVDTARPRADLKTGPYNRDVDTARARAGLKVGPYNRDVDTARARAGLQTGPDPRARRLAALSLACWTIGITTGRLLAYTHSRLMVDLPA